MLEKVAIYCFTGITILVLSAIIALPSAFFVMIALGVIHAHWIEVPALGFWPTVILLTAWRIVWPVRLSMKEE